MKRLIRLSFIVFTLLAHGSQALADVDITGYASIVAGKVISGDEFLADYPKAGVYDDDWSFSPDTSVGIQLSTDINDNIDFIVQAVSNGATDYDLELDWLYFNYQLNSELSVQLGRKRLPLYYYSDYFDVGYAYYWIRPPADNYTWQISNYNGLSVQYQPYIDDWDVLVNIYAGREDSDDNDLLGLLTGMTVDETWKNMVGVVLEVSKEWIDLRATYMEGELDRVIDGMVTDEDVKQEFSGISINFYIDDLIILSEFNQYKRPAGDIDVDTQMVSIGYQISDFTPHVTRSVFEQDENVAGGDEEHETTSIGLRWDIDKNTAFKIQYDEVKDKGVVIPVLGDSEAISFGVDVVF